MAGDYLMHDSFPRPTDAKGGPIDHQDVHRYSVPMGVTDDFGTGAFKQDEESAQEQEDFSRDNPKRDINEDSDDTGEREDRPYTKGRSNPYRG